MKTSDKFLIHCGVRNLLYPYVNLECWEFREKNS